MRKWKTSSPPPHLQQQQQAAREMLDRPEVAPWALVGGVDVPGEHFGGVVGLGLHDALDAGAAEALVAAREWLRW